MTADRKLCSSDSLMYLMTWADRTEQNRRAVTEELAPRLDPSGIHLLLRLLAFHNDQNVDRVMVFAKLKNSMTPAEFVLDIPHDRYEALNTPEQAGLL